MSETKAMSRLPAHNHAPYHPVCREQNIGDCILTDYEAAVNALAEILVRFGDGYYLLSDHAIEDMKRQADLGPVSEARAVLRRLRPDG